MADGALKGQYYHHQQRHPHNRSHSSSARGNTTISNHTIRNNTSGDTGVASGSAQRFRQPFAASPFRSPNQDSPASMTGASAATIPHSPAATSGLGQTSSTAVGSSGGVGEHMQRSPLHMQAGRSTAGFQGRGHNAAPTAYSSPGVGGAMRGTHPHAQPRLHRQTSTPSGIGGAHPHVDRNAFSGHRYSHQQHHNHAGAQDTTDFSSASAPPGMMGQHMADKPYQQQHEQQRHQQRSSSPFSGFEGVVPVRITTQSSERLQYVTLSLQFTTTSLDREVLSLQLTDPSDPFFLYCADIDQNDFLSLKRHQDIKVDFRAFPSEVEQLVRLCINETHEPVPRYVCELRCRDEASAAATAALHFIETNTFKNLNHLTLSVVPGDDAAVKSYLAECLRHTRAEAQTLQTTCDDLAAAVDSLRQDLASVEEDKARMQESLERQLQNTREELQRDKEEAVARTRQQLEQARQETETTLTKEHERRVSATRHDVDRLQTRVDELTSANEEALKRRYALEGRVNELELQLSRCQEQLDGKTAECTTQRRRADAAEAKTRALEDELARSHARVQELEQEVQERSDRVKDAESNAHNIAQQLEGKMQELEETQEHAEALTRTLQSCHTEIHRGNAIIAKYQEDLAKASSDLTARNRVTVQQEQRIERLDAECSQLKEDVASLQSEYERVVREGKENSSQAHSLRGTVDKLQQELKAKDRMIAWMSKRQQELEEKEKEYLSGRDSGGSKQHRVPLGGIDVNSAHVFQPPAKKQQQTTTTAPKLTAHTTASDTNKPRFRPAGQRKASGGTGVQTIPQPHPMPTKPSTDYSLLLASNS